jgi:hypothetical protein
MTSSAPSSRTPFVACVCLGDDPRRRAASCTANGQRHRPPPDTTHPRRRSARMAKDDAAVGHQSAVASSRPVRADAARDARAARACCAQPPRSLPRRRGRRPPGAALLAATVPATSAPGDERRATAPDRACPRRCMVSALLIQRLRREQAPRALSGRQHRNLVDDQYVCATGSMEPHGLHGGQAHSKTPRHERHQSDEFSPESITGWPNGLGARAPGRRPWEHGIAVDTDREEISIATRSAMQASGWRSRTSQEKSGHQPCAGH